MGHGKAVKQASCSTFEDAVMDRGERRPQIMGDGEALKHARSVRPNGAVMGGAERRPQIMGDGEALKHARSSTFKEEPWAEARG